MSNRKRGPKVVISGYYGFDNCGDEAVLLAIIHCLKRLRPDIRVTVLSNNPARTRELYGVNAVNRWNPLCIALALLTSRLLISGGGSLLQDVTSVKSPDYYLGVIMMALFLHKKVMIYSQGVGPLTDVSNRAKVSKVLNRCHAITLRDEYSAELLGVLGVNRDIPVTCDPVMAFSRDDIDYDTIKKNLRPLSIIDNKNLGLNPVLLVAVRCWKDDRHIVPIAEFLDTQVGEGWDVLLIPAHYPEDTDAVAMLSARMAMRPFCVDELLTADQFITLISSVDRVFSMRLHGLICAFAMGTPMIGLSYDPKIDAFMEQAGLGRYCLTFDDFDVELANRLMEELDNLPLQLRQERELRRLDMQDLAWDTADVAVWLLDSGNESPSVD
jgi:polysaccharide pyruvyl transferase CsaB